MAHLDGVKTPASHKKKVNHARVIAKKEEKRDAPIKPIEKKPAAKYVDDLSHLSIEERKRLMWIGVIVVMIAVVGVWVWLLPTSWRVTAKRTDSSDWDKLQKNLSKTFEEFQTKTAKEGGQLEQLRQNVFGNENANESVNMNLNNNAGQIAGEENNANDNINQQNLLPVIENINTAVSQ